MMPADRACLAEDEYMSRKRVRSLLCLPLLKQADLIGVLYLENSLASHVFTPARIAVLKLLASQAAIALEKLVCTATSRKREAKSGAWSIPTSSEFSSGISKSRC